MTIYTGVLFVHAIAVLVLTAGLTMEAWMLFQLRRASSPGDVSVLDGSSSGAHRGQHKLAGDRVRHGSVSD